MGRLVLGCGSVGHAAVELLAGGSGDLLVLDPDAERVETLREEGIAAERADPTDSTVLNAVDDPVDAVLVSGDDAGANHAAAVAARDAFPEAPLVVYAGTDPAPETVDALDAVADRVVGYGSAVAADLLTRTDGPSGERLRGIAGALRGIDGRLGVFMHDNPDPDAIGSAVALRDIARTFGVEADACYFGDIAHQENRALVNLLDLTLTNPDPTAELGYDGIALVDHSRPGVNDQLPEDTPVDIVIDHHPPRGPVEAGFADIRTGAGATSTLLVDYLRGLGVEVRETTATTLLYGIRVDTRDFSREVDSVDFDAAAYLLRRADVGVLERVENPSVTGDTLDTIARAITNRERRGPVLAAFSGRINNRDALAQAAERLLTMEGVTTSMVYGVADGTVYVSARTRGGDLDIGEAMREAFDQIGSAGGHAEMAGAQIPLGILGDIEEGAESLSDVVADVISNRFFEVIERPPRTPSSNAGMGTTWPGDRS